jgi:hypothetical protein
MREATDGDRAAHVLPAQALDQFDEHALKGDAMQRIAGLGLAHALKSGRPVVAVTIANRRIEGRFGKGWLMWK